MVLRGARSIASLSITLSALGVTSCSLFLSTGGLGDGPPLVDDGGPEVGDAGTPDVLSDTPSGADVAPNDGAGGDAGPDAADAGAPPADLVVTGTPAASAITVEVAGLFRLGFTLAENWQLTDWFDLAQASPPNLAPRSDAVDVSNDVLLPFDFAIGSTYYNPSPNMGATATLVDQRPARAKIAGSYAWSPTSGTSILVSTSYTIYPTGRVGVSTSFKNAAASPLVMAALEYLYTQVTDKLAWNVTAPGSTAAFFQRADGPAPHSNLLVVSELGNTNIGSDEPRNRYWDTGPKTLAPGEAFVANAEMDVAPGELGVQEVQDRAADALDPTVDAVTNGTGAFDPTEGAYAIQIATGGQPASFRLKNTRVRHAPAFRLSGWTTSTWTWTLNGTLVASSAQPKTARGTGFFDSASQTLVLVYFGDLAQGVGAPESTFTAAP